MRKRSSATPSRIRSAACSGLRTSPPPIDALAFAASPAAPARSIAVSTAPGQTHETRTPCAAYENASHSARPTAACLVVAYALSPIELRMPAIEAVVIRWPPPRSVQPGSRARAAKTCDIRLMRHWRSQTSSGASGPPPVAKPAFANHASIGPVSATSACVAASSPTSSTRATTRSPPSSSASRSTPAPSRSAATTVPAPRSISPRTSALPMPPAAPVTTMVLPSISMPGTLCARCAGPAPLRVRPQVDHEGEDHEEPLEPCHVAPTAPVPDRGIRQRRPRQQEEPEQRDDPAVERTAQDVAEDRQDEQHEPRG